ncbi:MAG TPA: hypothetical protein VGZ29_06465 [Terriglobia bacterium]|nr:hypothetical protein [Terriglobia bacterium]
MKRNVVAVTAAGMLIGILPTLGNCKKLSGQILDQQAFRNVHSYCIQTSDLGSRYAQMVDAFFKEQDKPNSLVNELPWKRVDDCSQADAVMSFKFSETEEPSYATAGGTLQTGATMGTMNTTWFQVTAVVSGKSDQKPIYQVQGERAPERGERAMEKTFKNVAKDLRSRE